MNSNFGRAFCNFLGSTGVGCIFDMVTTVSCIYGACTIPYTRFLYVSRFAEPFFSVLFPGTSVFFISLPWLLFTSGRWW